MSKHLQFTFLFIRKFVEKYLNQIVLGAVIGFLSTLFFLQLYPVYLEVFAKNHQRIGLVGRYTQNSLPLSIQNKISLGLTSLAQSGEATPSLAYSWDVEKEGTEYIFHLISSDVNWHDGEKFSAYDISFKLKGAEITPIDDNTLKIKLSEPFAPLPVVFSKPIFKDNLTGLGVYKVVQIEREENFIKEMTLSPQRKDLPTLTYKFYPGLEDAKLAFKLGKINILEDIAEVGEFVNWKNVVIVDRAKYDRFVGVFFNLSNQLFKEKEVRQALAYAIDEFPGQEMALTPLSPLSWAFSSKIRMYRFDPDISYKILEKSPLASPSSQITISTFASFLQTAQAVANSWNNVGVKSKVKVERMMPADFEVLVTAQTIPPDPDQYQFWQSTQEMTNLTHYSNPKIDKLLEDGRKTFDKKKRKEIYADFQRYLVDDLPVIFLYYPKTYEIRREK